MENTGYNVVESLLVNTGMVEYRRLFQTIGGKPGHCEKSMEEFPYGMTVHEPAVEIR